MYTSLHRPLSIPIHHSHQVSAINCTSTDAAAAALSQHCIVCLSHYCSCYWYHTATGESTDAELCVLPLHTVSTAAHACYAKHSPQPPLQRNTELHASVLLLLRLLLLLLLLRLLLLLLQLLLLLLLLLLRRES
jgi:hypothetical protein